MKKGWIIAFALLYAAICFTAAVVANRTKQMAEERAELKAGIAYGERDNAQALADQYKKQYQESLFEIADLKAEIEQLKAENEELDTQIDVLREPTEDAYKEIGWDFDYVVRVVGAEARGEPVDGILAVCECIANTAEDKGMTPEQVVKVPGQYTSPVSRSCTDNMDTVNECCCRVFLEGERPHSERIKYFYAYKNSYSSWHEGKTLCYTIGGHKYFKD